MNAAPDLLSENQALRERLEEAEAVLAAVRSGSVDALVTGAPGSRSVFTLEGAETPYRAFVESMHEGAATVDAGGCILYANEALARLLGRPLKGVIGSRVREVAVPEDREGLDALLRSGAAAGAQRALQFLGADGSSIPALVTVGPLEGASGRLTLVVSDLREHERGAAARMLLEQSERSRRALLSLLEDQTRTEKVLRRSNRALKTLSAGNEALVHATDEPGLLNEMVRILHEVGGYPIAWVGYALDDADKSIEPKACFGIDADMLRRTGVSWADNASGQTSLGRAIRLGQTQIVQDPAAKFEIPVWREIVQAARINKLLGLPLRVAAGERPFGAIGIGAGGSEMFDDDELRLLEELAGDLAYGIVNLRAGVVQRASAEKLRRSLEGTIGAVAATMESRDPYTAGHQRRVAVLAAAIATEMGVAAATVAGIHFGGLIHDLGKIQVPAEILSKPTRLTKLEFELIKVHAQAGYDIIKGIDFPWPISLMVLQHHERLDGSGYPQGLRGDAIALEARILAVADVVEAMSSHRPYRPGLGIEAALKEIEQKRGTWFEPAAVDACLKLFRDKKFEFGEQV